MIFRLIARMLPSQSKLASEAYYHMVGWELELVKLGGVYALFKVKNVDPHLATTGIAVLMLGIMYLIRRRWKKCLDKARGTAAPPTTTQAATPVVDFNMNP